MSMAFLFKRLTLTKKNSVQVAISTGDASRLEKASKHIVNSSTVVHERYSFPNLRGFFSTNQVLAPSLILPSR